MSDRSDRCSGSGHQAGFNVIYFLKTNCEWYLKTGVSDSKGPVQA